MTGMARKADGRRIFTAEFKQQQVARVQGGELTAAELARELDVQRTVVGRWLRLATDAATTAVRREEPVVPMSALRAAEARIRELEQALGRKTLEVEVLRAAPSSWASSPSRPRRPVPSRMAWRKASCARCAAITSPKPTSARRRSS